MYLFLSSVQCCSGFTVFCEKSSVADPGCLSLEPGSRIQKKFHPGYRIQDQKVPDPRSGSAYKNLGIFNPKKLFFISSRKYGSWLFSHPGSRGHNGTGSATLEKSVKINLCPLQQDILRDPGLPGPWDPEHLRPTQRCLRSQGIHVGAERTVPLYPGFHLTVFHIIFIFKVYSVLEF